MRDKTMTVEQAAEYLQVHGNTVRALLNSGRLPGRRIGGQWRISQAALERFVQTPETATRAGKAAV